MGHTVISCLCGATLQERRDHEIAVRLAEETGGGVEELTPSLKRSSSGVKTKK